jgi:hypothetical protein
MVGSQHEGAQTASFSLLAVASYTIHMSSSPLGTAKYFMYDLMVAPLAIVKYRRLITFLIFSINLRASLDCRWSAGPVGLLVRPSQRMAAHHLLPPSDIAWGT